MLLKELQKLSALYGIYPRKSLGQNFLIDEKVINEMASFGKNKHVFEIGAGFGFLSKAILPLCKHLTSVELDEKLYTLLRLEIQSDKFTLLNKDFLKINLSELNPDIIISAPPYFISKEIIKKIIFENIPEAVLLMQREFLDKITSIEGGIDYKAISVFFQSFYNYKIIRFVGKSSFYPSPSVDSALIHIWAKPTNFSQEEKKEYFSFLTKLFRHRNKTISNSLKLEKFPQNLEESQEKVMAYSVNSFLELFRKVKEIKK